MQVRPLLRLFAMIDREIDVRAMSPAYGDVLLLILMPLTGLLLLETPVTWAGRFIWLMSFGLFLLWQPVVHSGRHLGVWQWMTVLLIVAGVMLSLNWAWLALWIAFLAALVAGRLVMVRGRLLGWYYLLAFATLAFALFVWVSPYLTAGLGPSAVSAPAWAPAAACVLYVITVLFWRPSVRPQDGRGYDFLISLLVFGMLILVVMSTTTLMSISGFGHFEAMTRALLALGVGLLLASWAWSPRAGFGGLESILTTYLLKLGFPFDTWLANIVELAERQMGRTAQPEAFVEAAIRTFGALPWVKGGEWTTRLSEGAFGDPGNGVKGGNGAKGGNGRRKSVALSHNGVNLTLYLEQRWTVSVVWQANVLLRLVAALYLAKCKEKALADMQYLQAVHETGAKVVHDIKNLLQSLDGLCYVVEGDKRGADASPDPEVVALLGRQLPVIAQRLRSTVDKLKHPQPAAVPQTMQPFADWWTALVQRYRHHPVRFQGDSAAMAGLVPPDALDTVLDNLLSNALDKLAKTPELQIGVEVSRQADGSLRIVVADTGEPVPAGVAAGRFETPLVSENGLGVGLYQAAQAASSAGWRLEMASNTAGDVRFCLLQVAVPD